MPRWSSELSLCCWFRNAMMLSPHINTLFFYLQWYKKINALQPWVHFKNKTCLIHRQDVWCNPLELSQGHPVGWCLWCRRSRVTSLLVHLLWKSTVTRWYGKLVFFIEVECIVLWNVFAHNVMILEQEDSGRILLSIWCLESISVRQFDNEKT